MIGNNEMKICESQMIAALQQWIDGAMTSPPRVTGIKADPQSYGATMFVLTLSGEEQKVTP